MISHRRQSRNDGAYIAARTPCNSSVGTHAYPFELNSTLGQLRRRPQAAVGVGVSIHAGGDHRKSAAASATCTQPCPGLFRFFCTSLCVCRSLSSLAASVPRKRKRRALCAGGLASQSSPSVIFIPHFLKIGRCLMVHEQDGFFSVLDVVVISRPSVVTSESVQRCLGYWHLHLSRNGENHGR